MIQNWVLAAFRVGSQRRFKRVDLDEGIEEQTTVREVGPGLPAAIAELAPPSSTESLSSP